MKGFYSVVILNYQARITVTERTIQRSHSQDGRFIFVVLIRRILARRPNHCTKKRKEVQMKIKYFLNLKQKQQQHHLGIKCLVNVTPAVTFILVLFTSCKML